VALFMNNCPQYIVAHFAIQKMGAVVGPCGPLFKAAELEYQLNDLGARVVVAADNLVPVLAEGAGSHLGARVYVHALQRPAARGALPRGARRAARTAHATGRHGCTTSWR
jgi:acyl-CoA synthetase (AMP-forming)/AMP-acid ligase II